MITETEEEKLAFALTEQIKSSNKRWAFCVTIALISLSFNPTLDVQIVLASSIPTSSFFLVIVLALSLANVSFVVAHSASIKTIKMLIERIEERSLGDKMFSKNYSQRDVIFSNVFSSYNRIRPVVEWIRPVKLRLAVYRLVKSLSETIYFSLPVIALWNALDNIDSSTLIGSGAAMIGYLAIIPSIIVLVKAIFFVWTRKH